MSLGVVQHIGNTSGGIAPPWGHVGLLVEVLPEKRPLMHGVGGKDILPRPRHTIQPKLAQGHKDVWHGVGLWVMSPGGVLYPIKWNGRVVPSSVELNSSIVKNESLGGRHFPGYVQCS